LQGTISQPTNQLELSGLFSGEALGAIGNPEVLELLKQYSTDPVVEVRRPPPHLLACLGSLENSTQSFLDQS
jgi:hypothetical protein